MTITPTLTPIFTVDASQFKSAIARLKTVISKKQTHSLHEYVCITPVGEDLEFLVSNAEVWLTIKLPAYSRILPSPITLKFADLEALSKTIKVGKKDTVKNIDFRQRDGQWQGKVEGGLTMALQHYTPSAYFAETEEDLSSLEMIELDTSNVKSCIISSKAFKEAIGSVEYAVSKEHPKEFFRGINVRVSPGAMKLDATDGHRLVVSEVGCQGESSFSFINKFLPQVVKVMTGDNLHTNLCGEYLYVFDDEGTRFISKNVQSDYPKIENLFADTETPMVSVQFITEDLQQLLVASVAAVTSKVSEDTYMDIVINEGKAHFFIGTSKQGTYLIEKRLPCAIAPHFDQFTMKFKLDVLLDTVKHHKDKEFVIKHPMPGCDNAACPVFDQGGRIKRMLARCK